MNRRPLRILFTNHQLGEPGGTEVNVRDWAIGLLRRGHQPAAYAPVLGRTADLLRQCAIPVVDDLSQLSDPPDIIHGSHTPTIIESLVRFPRVPALQMCQSIGYPMSEPLHLPQVRRFIAVDELTRDFLAEGGAPAERIRVVHNCVDLRRIPPRPRALPARPERALIFTKTESQVPVVTAACRRAGIEVDTLGRGVGRVEIDPERELVKYDLVFATARMALEAIAAGCATVVMDGRGLAGMASRQNAASLRTHNFGARCLVHDVTLEGIVAEIERYDPNEAAALSAHLRPLIDAEAQLDAFERIHAEIVDEFAASPVGESELIGALGAVLHRWLPRFPGTDWPWQFERAALLAQVEQLDTRLAHELRLQADANAQREKAEAELRAARADIENFMVARAEAERQIAALHAARADAERQIAALHAARADAERQIAALHVARDVAAAEALALGQTVSDMQRSVFWRLRDRIVRRPGLHRALQVLSGLVRPTR